MASQKNSEYIQPPSCLSSLPATLTHLHKRLFDGGENCVVSSDDTVDAIANLNLF